MTLGFLLPPTPYVYRPLKLKDQGFDVYALQSALKAAGHPITLDGFFGPETAGSVEFWQEGRQLVQDGIAGIVTQRSLALKLGEGTRSKYRLPIKLLMGQIEKESGYQLGNHTARYTDGSYDLGLAQINNKQKGVTLAQAFDVGFALEFLGSDLRAAKDRYSIASDGRTQRLKERGLPTPDAARLWALAAGSHNRPAYTAWLAGEPNVNSKKPTPEQLEWVEGYIDRVTAYAVAYYSQTGRKWPT